MAEFCNVPPKLVCHRKTCGIIRQIVPQSELKLARERIAKFSKMELIGQNVNHYIEIFERAMALATPAHM